MNRLKLIFILMAFPFLAFAQETETDLGAILSLEGEKGLVNNLSLSFEEEIRLVTNKIGFDRSVTSLGLDYSLFGKRVKVGAYYAFIYLYNNDELYEPRHRYYFNLSYKEDVGDFSLSWRGRFQGTYRDEGLDRYKVNPKYVMKNRVQAEYNIWGSPWKPFLSCDLSTDLNNPRGYELTRIRFQGGTSWRLNRTDYLNFFLRWDEYLAENDPRVISLGIGFKRKF